MGKPKFHGKGKRKGIRPPVAGSNNVRGCGGKNAYADKRIAFIVARRRRKQSGKMIYPYQCGDCGFWHIGKDRSRPDGTVQKRGMWIPETGER